MKLSDLIQYRNQLEILSALPVWQTADLDLNVILHLISTHNIQFSECATQLIDKKHGIQQAFDSFEHTLTQIKTQLDQQIEIAEKSWFQDSYEFYYKNMKENVNHLTRRQPNLSAEAKAIYHTRILKHNSWHHAAMIVRPGVETFINDLVGCDPLYLIDTDHEFLKPAMNLYNQTYQNRLRPYVINEKLDEQILYQLPDAQFGLIFCYNFFNFRPFEIVKRWLMESYQKLKPGGVLVMTYNDCDRYKAVLLVEQKYTCYTPGKMIRQWANILGFEEIFCYHDDGPITWIEFKKPGESTSLRGGQALAEIIPKPVANSK